MQKTNSNRVTIADIAREVGVSPTTVSLVLNKKVQSGISKATTEHVLEAAIKLGYLQPTDENVLPVHSLYDIAIMLPDIINPSFTRFLAQISNYAFQSKIGLFVCNTNGSREVEQEYIMRLLDRNVAGILYVYTPTCTDLLKKAARKIPIVVVGDSTQLPTNANISTDNYQAARMLAEYLYNLGHRRIAYITPPINTVSVLRERRLLGLQDYFNEKGCGGSFFIYEHTSAIAPSSATASEVTLGQIQARLLLEEHPDITAIVAQGDMIAIGVYEALKQAGKRIPEDISVASFDDIEFARYINPQLTSVDTKLNMRSKFAFDYLLQMVAEGTENSNEPLFVTYRSTLCERDSTARVSK